jgi:hypothetical protein
VCYSLPNCSTTQRLDAECIHWVVVSCLDFFSESLVCQDLLLLKDFLGEAYFEFDYGLFVDYAIFGAAVIQEKFLVINFYGFAAFNVAHKPAEKEWMKVGLPNHIEGFLLFMVSHLVVSITIPYGRDSEHLNRFWRRRIDLDISGIQFNLPKEGSGILHIEFIVIELEDLIFMHIEIRVFFQEWFDRSLENSGP